MTGRAPFESAVGPVLERYLDLKEALGRRYTSERVVFERLDRFLVAHDADLTLETFTRWCLAQAHLNSTGRRNRMRIVRNLCLYRRRSEPDCFVPDAGEFPRQAQPVQPYIFSEREIADLLRVADGLERHGRSPLRREISRLAIVLLYTTGMRRGELLRLSVGDYDPRERTLLIRKTKFHKSRLLPLSPDGTSAIETFLEACRKHRLPVEPDLPLLRSPYHTGLPYTGNGLTAPLRYLFEQVGARTASGRLPRVHDLRHTFAVQALLRWYRSGADVQAKLPYLMTYMGHVSIVSTQYYLHFVADLAGSASERFAQCCGSLVTAAPEVREGSR